MQYEQIIQSKRPICKKYPMCSNISHCTDCHPNHGLNLNCILAWGSVKAQINAIKDILDPNVCTTENVKHISSHLKFVIESCLELQELLNVQEISNKTQCK